MKKIFLSLAVLLLFSLPTLAQDMPRFEIGGGYTFRSLNVPASPRFNMNGWNFNADYNLNNWLGVAGEINGTYHNNLNDGDNKVYTFMAGPRLFPLGHHRITPYAQALFGGGRYSLNLNLGPGNGNFTDSQTAFAWSAGGGVDVSVTRRIGWRLVQFQYEQTRFFNDAAYGSNPNQNNYTIDTGILFRF